MKLKLYTLLIFGVSLLLYSCKSASKMYQKGNYEAAVQLASKKLSKKPNDAATQDILQNAYRYAVDDHEARIRNISATTSEFKYEQMLNEYLTLQNLYETIRRTPSVYEKVNPTDYSSFISTYQQEASNARVGRGDALMNTNNKLGFRDAYYEFQKALALKPGDITIRQKMDEAFANAVTNVVIQPLTRYGFQYTSYNFDYANFDNSMMRYLTGNSHNTFVQYYSGSEANGMNLRADNVVDMKFSDVNIGRYRDSRDTREVTKQVVVKERVITKDSTVKEYAWVKAKITTITRVLQADGLLQATAHTYDGQRIWSDTYRGDYSWQASFSSYTGDERALDDADRKLVNQQEQFPPSNNDIISIIMKDIQYKAQCGISEYFNRIN